MEKAEHIRGREDEPSVDNYLKITHEARLLGTDANSIVILLVVFNINVYCS